MQRISRAGERVAVAGFSRATAVVRRRQPRQVPQFVRIAHHVVQGWVAGTDGISPTHTIAIVLAEVLNAAWMTWLLVVAWRMPASTGVH